MSLLKHPSWPEIRPYVRIEIYAPDGGHAKPRFRLEFSSAVTQEQKRRWIQIIIPCAACGAAMAPIRQRKAGGRSSAIGHLYIATACPLDVCTGCSRGTAASLEYLRIRAAVESGPPPAQPVNQQPTLL